MLDLIPFAGGRRQMTDGNGQAALCGKLLQLYLPQPVANPVGPASISNNEQLLTGGIELYSDLLPPSSDTLHGKFRRLMVDANIDEACVVGRSLCCGRGHRCRREWLSHLRWNGNHTR